MQNTVQKIPDRLAAVLGRIESAAEAVGRSPAEISLLAVSKRHPASAVRELAAAGQQSFGENYVSEALEKIHQLEQLDLQWHYIGPLQSNKTRQVADHFAWVHSVDRPKLLQRLSRQRAADAPPLNCCLQVNIGGEAGKSGIPAEDFSRLADLAACAASLPGLRLRGLMSIPPPTDQVDQQRRQFACLAGLRDRLVAEGHALDTLSMGMSNDLEAAIAEGATLVRVGTALFGPRPD